MNHQCIHKAIYGRDECDGEVHPIAYEFHFNEYPKLRIVKRMELFCEKHLRGLEGAKKSDFISIEEYETLKLLEQ